MTPEGIVKAAVKRVLDATPGVWYFMPSMNGYGRAGIPDIIGSYKGRFFAVEVKAAKGKLTPAQERERDKLLEIGAVWVLAQGGSAAYVVSRMLKEFDNESADRV